MRRVLALAWILNAGALCAPALSFAQGFDAATVKPTASDEPFGDIDLTPGRLVATASTLGDLVQRAYELPAFRVEGGPDWIASARFDVIATAGGAATRTELLRMLRQLLAERFALKTHIETRELPVFDLALARRDGRLGPRMTPSTLDCTAALAGRGLTDTSPPDTGPAECQPRLAFTVGPQGGTMGHVRRGLSMANLAALIVPFVRRPVVDRTGLQGTYDVELTFSPETVQYILSGGGPLQTAQRTDGTSIHTAVQEQLGLKLESARGPVTVLVVESAARPAAD